MKITRASIKGFMGIDRADLQLGRVNVFVGANGSGKSTILEALLFPIFGEVPRPAKKKDWGYMIRDHHGNAEIFMQVVDSSSGEPIPHDLHVKINPKSHSVSPLKHPDLFDRVLLDPLSFFELPAKVKADLAGDVKLDPTVVGDALRARGMQEGGTLREVVDIIMTHRMVGAEKVLEQKRLAATRAVLDPGPEPTFVLNGAPAAAPTPAALDEVRRSHRGWTALVVMYRTKIDQAAQASADLEVKTQLAAEAQEVLDRINVPDEFPRQDELVQAVRRGKRLNLEYEAIEAELAAMPGELCPTCGQKWTPGYAEKAKQGTDLYAALTAERRTLDALRSEEADWKARRHEQALAVRKIKDLEDLGPKGTVNVEEVKSALQEAETNAATCQAWISAVEVYQANHASWLSRTDRANVAKAARKEWDWAVQVIRDPEFKAELASDPLSKVRSRLGATQGHFGLRINLSNSLDVEVNGRPWWLLSTSQKLRASILLADAFAHAGGSRILKIDGIDVLVGAVQVQLMQFLRAVAGDYDTVLLALATEATPVAYQALEAEQARCSQTHETYEPLARWFWVFEDAQAGATAVFKRDL